jgi:hypothetical protein
MEDIKVRNFKCKCGKSRLLSVIEPGNAPLSKEQKKAQMELVEAGCEVEIISLEKARESEMCFSCEI